MSWIKLAVYVAVVLALLGLKAYYDNGIKNAVRESEVKPLEAKIAKLQEDWDRDKSERNHAFTKVMTDYVAAAQDAEKAKKGRDDAIRREQQDRHARVATIPRGVADVRIPVVAGVLNDEPAGVERGSPSAAGAAGQPERGAAGGPAAADAGETTVGLWAEWSATMKDLYQSCRSQVIGMIDFYNDLRNKQAKELQP